MGGRTIGIYITTTVAAVTIGLIMVNTIKPGTSISEETRQELVVTYQSDAAEKQVVARKQKGIGVNFTHTIIHTSFTRPSRRFSTA